MNEHEFAAALERAKGFAKSNQHDTALSLLDELVDANASKARLWVTRAFVYALKKDYDRAVADMDKAITLNATEPDFFFTRGRYTVMCGRLTEAIEDATKALELCDRYASDYYRDAARLLRAEANLRLGRCEQAKRDCEQIGDEVSLWIDGLRSKRTVLAGCNQGGAE